ncbi:MAG: hypothetical protein J7L61_00285 [Thermoplasmata archaeon]|nr:hypothetical protein [Thermoplasmata archaeon]
MNGNTERTTSATSSGNPPQPLRSQPIPADRPQIHCPNCGRYIGPVETCPYCGFKIPKKASYKALKYGVLIWGIVGVLLLQQIYGPIPNPEVKIADLGPENNYGRIVIEGMVTRTPTYYDSETKEYGTLYFTVDDGTGEMQVISYDTTTIQLVKAGKIPAFGDHVRVEGTYQYRDYKYSMILDSPLHLTIERPEPYETTVAFIDNALEEAGLTGDRVTVEGYVESWDLYDWALSMWITDYQGHSVNFYVPSAVWKLTGEGSLFGLEVGQHVRVTGALMWYESGRYSRWEIIPATSDDFVILDGGA